MRKTSTTTVRALLATTVLASVALASGPAWAQQAAESGDETIVVTGTLVRNPNLVSSSPVSVTTAEEIDLQQANVAEELLRELPGATPSIGSAVNNGNEGASQADLRGLGPNRNIVLLDGVRVVPSTLQGTVDLNNVPLALIQRVDVLTGGASTTYGADAVSGVVNFITRQDFAGIDINLSEQITERGDGNVFRGDVTIGANIDDGRGNIVFSVGYQQSDAVYQGARDFSEFSIDSTNGRSGGSQTTVPTRFSLPGNGTQQIVNGRFDTSEGFNAFNFNPLNIFQTPFQRYNMYGAANYEVSDGVEIYTRGLFSKNTVETIIAPSGSFGIGVDVALNNGFMTPDVRNGFCSANGISQADCDAAALATGPSDPRYRTVRSAMFRRAVEAGPRISSYTTTLFDYRLGARGGITDTIEWDVAGSYGESSNIQSISGYLLNSRIRQSLLVQNGPGGTQVCQNPANGCLPVNWFGPEGSLTPEAIEFLTDESTVARNTSLAQARAIISGDFGWALPWADQPVSFAVGGEFREYQASRKSDSLAQSGDLAGAGGARPNIDGAFDTYEAFAELIIPIASERPFFEELLIEGGIRYSSYNVHVTDHPGYDTTTWKLGGTWAPVRGLRFRGNYAHSVRAPNIEELFSPQNTVLANLANDPCATRNGSGVRIRPNPTGTLRAICLAQGATAATIDSIAQPISGQTNTTGGGSLTLQPETSDSWTVGAVFQPSFVPGLSLTADYYHIRVTDAITEPTPGDGIFACFGSDPLNPPAGAETREACRIIRRDPLTGNLNGDPATTGGIYSTLTNQGILVTSGIDFSANYQRDLGFAGLNMNFILNWTEQSIFQSVAGETLYRECVGYYSANCGSPAGEGTLQPEWQWSLRTTLNFDDIDVSLLWRHIDSMRYEPILDPLFKGKLPASAGKLAGREVDFNRIPAYDYFDLTTRFTVSDNLGITLSVQNLFDKQPPVIGNSAGTTAFNSGNTYPSTYDALGRRFVAAARLRF